MATVTPTRGDRIVFGDGSMIAIDSAVLGYDDDTWCVIDERRLGWIVRPFPEIDIGIPGSRAWRAIRRRVAVNENRYKPASETR